MNNLNDYKVWTAIVTPMLDDGKIDFESFGNLLKLQVEAGNALTVLGSTGEALGFSLEEKKQILDFVIGHKFDIPIKVGVSGIYLPDQISWIEYLNTISVDAYLVPVPYYTKPGRIGQTEWFRSLLDISDRPVCIYNVPGRTAVKLDVEALRDISSHDNFWAVKEASGSVDDFKAYSEASPNAHMLSGDDPMFARFSRLGAKGVVSVAANVWPEQTQLIARQFMSDNFENEEIFSTASKSLFSASNPIPTKAILNHRGNIKTSTVRPPLSAKDMMGLDQILAIDKQLTNIINL